MSNYYFITSKLNEDVLDVNGASTAAGTAIISYPRKTSGTDNQLWGRVPTRPKDPAGGQSQYYIKSQLNGYVLDFSGANTNPGTSIINYPTNSPASNNKIRQIIDISCANKAAGTQIISYPKNSPTSDNQLWTFVEQSQQSSSSKKSASA